MVIKHAIRVTANVCGSQTKGPQPKCSKPHTYGQECWGTLQKNEGGEAKVCISRCAEGCLLSAADCCHVCASVSNNLQKASPSAPVSPPSSTSFRYMSTVA